METAEETRDVGAPAAFVEGIWLIATEWLAPVALSEVRMKITVQINALGKSFTREYHVSAGDVYGAFQLLLGVIGGAAESYGVPLADMLRTTDSRAAVLQSFIRDAVDYNLTHPHIGS